MKEIIAPVDKDLIKSELTIDRFLRSTNKANNEIYIVKELDSSPISTFSSLKCGFK
jgi:hypothetical protein